MAKSRLWHIAVILSFLTIPITSFGQDVRIIGNLEAPAVGSTVIHGGNIKAMGFVSPELPYDLTEIILSLQYVSPVHAVLDAAVYSNGPDNNPAVKLLSFQSRIATNATSGFRDVYLRPVAPPFNTFRLKPSTVYWLVVRAHGVGQVFWRGDTSGTTSPSGAGAHFGMRVNAGDGQIPKVVSSWYNNYEVRGTFAASTAWFLQDPTTGQIGVAGFRHGHFTMWRTFPQVVGSAWDVLQFGIFGGTPYADALLRNKSTGQLAFWYTNGENFYQFINIPQTPPSVWEFKGVGQFGEFRDLLVYQNPQSGVVVVGAHNGNQITQWRIFPKVPNLAWEIVAVGDFDGDGMAGMMFRNKTTGQIAVWRTNGFDFTTWHVFPQVPNQAWEIIGVGSNPLSTLRAVIFENKSTRERALWSLNEAGTAFQRWMPLTPQPASHWDFKGYSLIEAL